MRKAPTPTARGFTSDNGTLESYNLSEVIGPAQASSNSADLDDDAIEIPWAVDQAIASWRRILHQTEHKAKLFRNASQELQALAEKHPPEIRLMIIDALQLMAADAGIGTDDPQAIMAADRTRAEAKPPPIFPPPEEPTAGISLTDFFALMPTHAAI